MVERFAGIVMAGTPAAPPCSRLATVGKREFVNQQFSGNYGNVNQLSGNSGCMDSGKRAYAGE